MLFTTWEYVWFCTGTLITYYARKYLRFFIYGSNFSLFASHNSVLPAKFILFVSSAVHEPHSRYFWTSLLFLLYCECCGNCTSSFYLCTRRYPKVKNKLKKDGGENERERKNVCVCVWVLNPFCTQHLRTCKSRRRTTDEIEKKYRAKGRQASHRLRGPMQIGFGGQFSNAIIIYFVFRILKRWTVEIFELNSCWMKTALKPILLLYYPHISTWEPDDSAAQIKSNSAYGVCSTFGVVVKSNARNTFPYKNVFAYIDRTDD